MKMHRAQIVFLLCLVAPHLLAQEGSCLRRTVPVSITTEEGYPIQDLSRITLTGKFRGKPVKILSLEPNRQPPRIVIVLDASGSMLDSKWPVARMAARNLIEVAPPKAQLALLIFGTRADAIIPFESERSVVIRSLDALPEQKGFPTGRRTALWDSIFTALDLLGQPQPGDAIYAITDGGDNTSRRSWGEVQRALLEGGVRLFASILVDVSFNSNRRRTPEEFTGPTEMMDLAEATGGSLFSLTFRSAMRDFDESVRIMGVRLYRQIAGVYWVAIELPEAVDKPRSWKIELNKEKGAKTRGLQLHYPRKLLPCAPGK